MAKKRAAHPPPTVPPCLLFCDAVILEHGTGKTTLVGTYSGASAATFPSPPRDLHVYAQLTSFVGEVLIRLVCVRLSGDEPEEIYSTEHTVQFRGKLIVEQVHFVLNLFQFPSPGEYVFQVWAGDSCIAERRLTVRSKGDET